MENWKKVLKKCINIKKKVKNISNNNNEKDSGAVSNFNLFTENV